MYTAISIGVFLIFAFIVWRRMSVSRGALKRDQQLINRIEPVAKRIEAGERVTPDEIGTLAAQPELRHMLFSMLRDLKREDLLPDGYSSTIQQGESALAYWMMHPNELQAAPEAIEYVETHTESIDAEPAEFHVYRYRMPAGHWAGSEWLLGLAGPMANDTEPYSHIPFAFSRASMDIETRSKPSELVAW